MTGSVWALSKDRPLMVRLTHHEQTTQATSKNLQAPIGSRIWLAKTIEGRLLDLIRLVREVFLGADYLAATEDNAVLTTALDPAAVELLLVETGIQPLLKH